MKKTIEHVYKFTNNTRPIWRVARKTVTRRYQFEAINPKTGETIGTTYLIWKHDTKDAVEHPLYHGCSYCFIGYNPMPVTDWFHGVPLKQMFKWCHANNLVGGECVTEHVHITYEDKSYVPKDEVF